MELDFGKLGNILPAVIQDDSSSEVLMVGFMNKEAFSKTFESGFVHFFSRTKQRIWMKGEESGHRLKTKEIWMDCDEDSLVIKVDIEGPGVCHKGYRSCFYRRNQDGEWKEIPSKVFDPSKVYQQNVKKGEGV